MSGKVDRRRVRTQAAVLDAAEKLFIERGYRDTAIEAIADEADVAISSIYFNFEGGKSGLYLALARRAADLNVEYLAGAYDDELGTFEQLAAVGDAYAKFHLENPLALRLLSLNDVDSKGDPVVRQAAADIQARLQSMLDRQEELVQKALDEGGNKGVSASAVTLFLFGAWNGAISMYARGQLSRKELTGVLGAGQGLAIGAIRTGNAAGLTGSA